MKKLLLPIMLLLLSPLLWAASPKPGTNPTHDGSLRPGIEIVGTDDGVRRSSALAKASGSTKGNKKILVILARFKDNDFMATHDKVYYLDLLQGSGASMKDYYQKQSRGKLNLSFQVLGPYTTKNNFKYYGENDNTFYENDQRPGTLVQEMLEKVEESGDADADLDNCGVIIIHSGMGEEEDTTLYPDYIWSHKSSLTERKKYAEKYNIAVEKSIKTVTIGTKTFDTYMIVPEYDRWANGGIIKTEATIGVFCHEFGHILGLKDAYDGSYATAGVGQWSLMGSGEWGTMGYEGVAPGSDPAPFMAWELVELGWITENNITPAAGSDKYYTFNEMNSQSSVYRVDLGNNQYLTLEGKAKNLTGSGMAVYESGLLISQIHDGIIAKYSANNTINSSRYRPHGSMVVEAVASNYKANGLGNLWRGGSNTYRITTTALFRSSTLTSVGPVEYSDSDLAFLPIFINTIIGSGIVISMVAALYTGRRRLCLAIAAAVTTVCISMSCVIESGGGGGGGTYDKGPNTNYYTSIDNVHSKTGNSGITIYDIQCDEYGNGSFRIKKD